MCRSTSEVELDDRSLENYWNELFPDFNLVSGDEPTHMSKQFQKRIVACLDRLYVNYPVSVLYSNPLHAGRVVLYTDPQLPSDHVPVFARYHSTQHTAPDLVPKWAARHPQYSEIVDSIVHRMHFSNDLPTLYDQLVNIVKLACQKIVDLPQDEAAQSCDQKLYWIMRALRYYQTGDYCKLCWACNRFVYVKRCFDISSPSIIFNAGSYNKTKHHNLIEDKNMRDTNIEKLDHPNILTWQADVGKQNE